MSEFVALLLLVQSASASPDLIAPGPAHTKEATQKPADAQSEADRSASHIKISVSRAGRIAGNAQRQVSVVQFETKAAVPIEPKDSSSYTTMPNGWPIRKARISSLFGMRTNPVTGHWARHSGVDFVAPTGTQVHATGSGQVAHAGWSGGYGLLVVVRHAEGFETRYAHLSALAVSVGSQVSAGQVVGLVGSTGRSTGPHLHYEVRRNGHAIDPLAK